MTTIPDAVLAATPAVRARAAADALGDDDLTRWCVDLLAGRAAYGDAGEPDPGWLAGRASQTWGSPERPVGSDRDYWVRTWAARTLLYVWDEQCAPDIVVGLEDRVWRVREMCAKVVVRWDVGAAAAAAADLLRDENVRVRVAALRALAVVGEHEHLAALEQARDEDEPAVRTAADRAARRLRGRLDTAYP